MPRGPLTQKTKQERAKQQALDLYKKLGIEIPPEEEITKAFKPPAETKEDKIFEAQSVLNYFESRGENFKQIECRNCGLVFAYDWTFNGVKYCSVHCMKAAMEKIGIDWDTNRHLSERYLPHKSRPAVVPPQALVLVQELVSEIQEDSQLDKSQSESLEQT